jgi:hypothetical protein
MRESDGKAEAIPVISDDKRRGQKVVVAGGMIKKVALTSGMMKKWR